MKDQKRRQDGTMFYLQQKGELRKEKSAAFAATTAIRKEVV
jgi:hypothetical protein